MMRRRLSVPAGLALVSLALLIPGALTPTAMAGVTARAAAAVTTDSATSAGLTATFSYAGEGITTSNVRLELTKQGKVVYDQALPKAGCHPVCAAGDKHPVQIADLYGDGGQDVVLTLFSGGADCCTIDDVFVPSAAIGSYVVDSHNFGEAGAVLQNIGPKRRPLFVSADPAFYCRFTDCAGSGLPLQILEFEGERFVDVTKTYPQLIAADAARWLRLYYREPSDGEGLIAAYAADEYNLGASARATADTVLDRREVDGSLKQSFVRALLAFLKSHHYG
jgi:hypothetical protein